MATTKIPCIDGAAYKDAAKKHATAITRDAMTWAAIQVALLLGRRTASAGLSDMREELAERRVAMAEEVLAHAKKTWPKEIALLRRTMSEARHSPDYSGVDVTEGYCDAAMADMTEQYDAVLQQQGMSSTLCADNRMGRMQALARTDIASHAMRAAEARALALNDRRFSRQHAMMGLGRGVLKDSLTFGQLGGQLRSAISDTLIGTINSAMSLWGYSSTRFRTQTYGWNTSYQDVPRVVAGARTALYSGLGNTARNSQTVAAEQRIAFGNVPGAESATYGVEVNPVAPQGDVVGSPLGSPAGGAGGQGDN